MFRRLRFQMVFFFVLCNDGTCEANSGNGIVVIEAVCLIVSRLPRA